jgi:hypothetical protein
VSLRLLYLIFNRVLNRLLGTPLVVQDIELLVLRHEAAVRLLRSWPFRVITCRVPPRGRVSLAVTFG